jgi:hypothetical protein
MLWYTCLIKHDETLLRTKDWCTHSLLHAQQDALTHNKKKFYWRFGDGSAFEDLTRSGVALLKQSLKVVPRLQPLTPFFDLVQTLLYFQISSGIYSFLVLLSTWSRMGLFALSWNVHQRLPVMLQHSICCHQRVPMCIQTLVDGNAVSDVLHLNRSPDFTFRRFGTTSSSYGCCSSGWQGPRHPRRHQL